MSAVLNCIELCFKPIFSIKSLQFTFQCGLKGLYDICLFDFCLSYANAKTMREAVLPHGNQPEHPQTQAQTLLHGFNYSLQQWQQR